MLSLIKEHIITKISGLTSSNHKTLHSLLTLRKLDNGDVTFHLHKEEAENVLGFKLKMDNIKTDSLVLKVSEATDLLSQKNSVSFHVDKKFIIKNLISNNNHYFENDKNHVLVEFSSPNIAKPFHIGHFRSTIVGNFVANCAEKKFGKATKLNYLGDWGSQIGFVKTGLNDMGITDEELSKDPLRILYEAYVNAYNQPDNLEKAKRFFSELEYDVCNEEEKTLWKKIRKITMENLSKTYADLGIIFDEYCYESDYRISKIKGLLGELEKSGIARKRSLDGLLVLCASSDLEIPLVRDDGTSLYLSRDIAAAFDRLQKYKDCLNIFYVVDKSQVQHFDNVAKAIFSLTGRNVVKHIQFGRVTGVSSRKGTNLLLQEILDKAVEKMALQQLASKNSRTHDPEVTKTLAVTALLVYILRQARCRNFVFNWDLAILGKGDSGIKLQYTHCRLSSLEENSGVSIPNHFQPELIKEQILEDLILEIARCEEVMQYSVETLESSYLLSYLFKFCNLISRCLSQIPVKGEPIDVAQQRLLVYHKARVTLADCMLLLGLKPLQKM